MDGTGSPAYFADVGIRQGRIAAIGKLPGQAKEEIDGQGLIVAPGFIDVHTHAEEIVDLPLAENLARLGVTSIVTGNCEAPPSISTPFSGASKRRAFPSTSRR